MSGTSGGVTAEHQAAIAQRQGLVVDLEARKTLLPPGVHLLTVKEVLFVEMWGLEGGDQMFFFEDHLGRIIELGEMHIHMSRHSVRPGSRFVVLVGDRGRIIQGWAEHSAKDDDLEILSLHGMQLLVQAFDLAEGRLPTDDMSVLSVYRLLPALAEILGQVAGLPEKTKRDPQLMRMALRNQLLPDLLLLILQTANQLGYDQVNVYDLGNAFQRRLAQLQQSGRG